MKKKGKLKPGLIKWEDKQRATWFLLGALPILYIWLISLW